MARISNLGITAAVALVIAFAACGGAAVASDADATDTAHTAAVTGPTKAALITLEKTAYEAWKSKDDKFWGTFLSDRFIGWGSSGRLDKASATKEYTGEDCDVRAFAISAAHISSLGKDAALITHKLTVDGTCSGQMIPSSSWVASVYVRDGDKWRAVFHAQAAIVDPKSPHAKSVDAQQALNQEHPQPADPDARTAAMLAAEKAVWEAWRAHDGTKIAALTAREISFINIFGVYLASKADALKDWSGTYCDVKSVSITDAKGTMLSPTVGILTHRAAADGTCFGQKVGAVWGSSVYVKHGDAWKWTFGINLPERREGT